MRSNRRHRSPDRLPVQHNMLLTLIAGWLQRRLSASVRRRRCPLTWLKSLARDDSGLLRTAANGPSSGWQCGGTRWSPLTSTHQHISMWTCTGHASRPDRIGIRLTSAPDHLTCVATNRCCVSTQTVMRASTDSSPGTALGLPGSPNRVTVRLVKVKFLPVVMRCRQATSHLALVNQRLGHSGGPSPPGIGSARAARHAGAWKVSAKYCVSCTTC
jgi:hypothetical protein